MHKVTYPLGLYELEKDAQAVVNEVYKPSGSSPPCGVEAIEIFPPASKALAPPEGGRGLRSLIWEAVGG